MIAVVLPVPEDFEPELPELVEPELPELVEPELELVDPDELELDTAVVLAFFARAGS